MASDNYFVCSLVLNTVNVFFIKVSHNGILFVIY